MLAPYAVATGTYDVSYDLHDWRGLCRQTGPGGGQLWALSHSTERLPVPIVR